jgi:hypothetical protein
MDALLLTLARIHCLDSTQHHAVAVSARCLDLVAD